MFIYVLILQVLLGCATKKTLDKLSDPESRFSILQGSTTENNTTFRIVYPKSIKVKYVVTNSAGKKQKVKVLNSFSRKHSAFKVDHVFSTGLNLNEAYTLKVSSNHKVWQDERFFKTLDTNKKEMTFLIASCMSDGFNGIGDVMWPMAFSLDPDVTFLIGDNIYADVFSGVYLGGIQSVEPQHLWDRYVDHAMKLKLYFMKSLKPTYVTWDDHDFGTNNGNMSYPFKRESKKILSTFFARRSSNHLKMGPGVSSLAKLGGMNFFFLDGRSFRSAKDNPLGSHFGNKQRAWLKANLKKDQFNWLISGDQFFGAYHPFESFQGDHPETFKSFLRDVKSTQAKVGFLSGDRHLIEVMKIPQDVLGYMTYEYTVSGIQTKMYPGSLERNANPYRASGFDGIANYALIKTRVNGSKVETKFQAYSPSGQKINTEHTYLID